MLRSTSICAKFLYKYLLSDSECTDNNGNSINKKAQKLRCLSDTLQSYGGVLSKISQILSLNDKNSNVFSECKPFSKNKTIKYFIKYIQNKGNITQYLDIDYEVYKSGSVGQVHKATYNGLNIIFKVQYVGLEKQMESDLKMLDKITSYLYKFADMKEGLLKIKTKMYEELDYELEKENQMTMFNIFKNSDYIQIPKVISSLSDGNVIAMEFVEGMSLPKFIDNSTQEQRNKVGSHIVNFVFSNIYINGFLYSDTHYGNFLVKSDDTIAVLDFGCLHKIDKKLQDNLIKVHKSLLNSNTEDFYSAILDIGIIKEDISKESKDFIYEYFMLQYSPWIKEEFTFTEEWLDKVTDKHPELMKEWHLPSEMVYFNKIPYGCYHILTKLGLKGNFKTDIFKVIFDELEKVEK